MSRKSSKLLIDEPPLQVLPTFAKAVGLNEAIIAQQVHYWLETFRRGNNADHFRDGRWWVYNTFEEWQRDNFPFWSKATVERGFASLEQRGILVVGNFDGGARHRRNWYSIDYDALYSLETITSNCGDSSGLSPQIAVNHDRNRRSSITSNCGDNHSVAFINTETSSETSTENISAPSGAKEQEHRSPDAENVWRAMLEELSIRVTPSSFNAWIAPAQAVAFKDGTLTLRAPTTYCRDRLNGQMRAELKRAAERAVAVPVKDINITIGDTHA